MSGPAARHSKRPYTTVASHALAQQPPRRGNDAKRRHAEPTVPTVHVHVATTQNTVRKPRLVVTGLNGIVGGALLQHMGDDYELVGFSRRPMATQPNCHVQSIQGDVADFDAVLTALEGADGVVHLAVTKDVPPGDYVQANCMGTYNVLEAARQLGIPRVVYASSGQVTEWPDLNTNQPIVEPYGTLCNPEAEPPPEWEVVTKHSEPKVLGLYGASKLWGESLGRMFAGEHGLSVLCIRLGHVTPSGEPEQARDISIYCSHRDAAQMVRRCVEAPSELHFDIFYALSNNSRGYCDIQHAKDVLGYEPMDSADSFFLQGGSRGGTRL